MFTPSPFGGGQGWGQVLKQCWHRACPHPSSTCSRQRRPLFCLSKSAPADLEPQAAAPGGEGVRQPLRFQELLAPVLIGLQCEMTMNSRVRVGLRLCVLGEKYQLVL